MGRAAALLIDLENFFIGREAQYNRNHPGELYEFAVDLDSLCTFATDVAGERRLVVRRAYANFNDRRPGEGDRRWDYYLQPLPRFLMEQGIEPVQVFRFPGGGNKNAADMRLAMDATSLLSARSDIDQFILITGDSDFIPLVLELKLRGAEVVVIGVTGCTKTIFGRYCDRFEYFEDLLAARELQKEDSAELAPVREALRNLLERKSPIKFAAVKPLLSDELGHPFDPSRFACETTGEFLRKHARALDVGVRRGEHDWEILPRVELAADDVAVEPLLEPEAATEPEADLTGESEGERPVEPGGPVETLYRDLLRQGIPRCYVVPYEDWKRITDAVFRVARNVEAEPVRVLHQELLADVTESSAEDGIAEAARKVRDAAFQLFKAGCFHCADDDAGPGQTDFHWSRSAWLDPGIPGPEELRRRTWAYLVKILDRRLEQRGLSEQVQPGPLAELLAGPDPDPENVRVLEELCANVRAPQADAAANPSRST